MDGEGGNANRFENEAECMRNCSHNAENIYPMDASKACLLKRAEGGCNGNCVKYYYDSSDKKCKEFIWTGCVGNGNRFHDYNSCNSTCYDSAARGKNLCNGGCKQRFETERNTKNCRKR
ncbi:U-actitoxin-Avd3n-like [Maylandia zebra]|uniref:U-actitoxin-Avd3n-like n=1 Tax=Maylandia zebra TaxID=106582 RepID=UPI00403C56FC